MSPEQHGYQFNFSLQTYLSEMEGRLSASQREMEARLGLRIDEVKHYCPNTAKVARFDAFIKWALALGAPTLAATIGALVAHILHATH